MGNGSYSTAANWWEFKRSNTATAKKYSRPTGDKNASFSATAAGNLYSTLLNKGWGVYEGSYRETNGVTPEFTPTAVKTGDVLLYNWGTGSGISHTAMQVGIGTTAAGDLQEPRRRAHHQPQERLLVDATSVQHLLAVHDHLDFVHITV